MSTHEAVAGGFPEFGPGDRIRLIRRKMLRMPQKVLAERIGVEHGTLGAWETGRNEGGITPSVAKKIELLSGQSGTAAYILLGERGSGGTQPPEPGLSVRREGLEPPTRWLSGSRLAAVA